MDLEEARRKLYDRVHCLDADNVLKIMGYLLLQEWEEQEMLRLALGSDIVLHSLITKARKELGITSPIGFSSSLKQQQQLSPRPFISPESSHFLMNFSTKSQSALYEANGVASPTSPHYHNSLYDQNIASKERLLLLKDTMLSSWRPCRFFAKGYCKHGSSCRFVHESIQQKVGLSTGLDQNRDHQEVEGSIEIGSFEVLEKELRELLRGRSVVSIATLPQLYYDNYGKLLQADRYFSHPAPGKSGHHNLIKLLIQMPKTVTIVRWPHGQYAAILAEDTAKFMAYTGGSLDATDAFNSSSRQIYLTFPAESTFTEENASDYFTTFGPVQDVRIPNQQKRMFGFVTFTYAETVRKVLSEGNPHYIMEERVLVKPYKEKAKLAERKYLERLELLKYPYAHNIETSHGYEASEIYKQLLRRQIAEGEQDPVTALQQKLALLHLANIQKQNMEAKNSNSHIRLQQIPSMYEEPQSDDFESRSEELFDIHSTPYECVLDVLNTFETAYEDESIDYYEDKHMSNTYANSPPKFD
ncbi:hypothetical protein O6H91_06G016600 [Diphasiastrum complanatum]|uniref:Uncharacterized protein n=1 Tax=Diphasiastrum complanatum TaxID=34168 RepID=A0ACC2DBA1_DIPCM|nr:hypothetical protein O6H91_06G016600 [Diphasiastrum complanatum]